MESTTVTPERIPRRRLSRIMNLNIAAGSMGSAWFVVCSPQAIFNVYIMNHLGASASTLGFIVAITQFAALFHLASIFIYARLSRKKAYWIALHLVHRLFGLVLAATAIAAAGGTERSLIIRTIFFTISVSWVLFNLSSSGWWSWMADLFPERTRGAYFLRRSAVLNVVNILWFFAVTIALDVFPDSLFLVYAVVFLIGGIAGILDILLYLPIPEPSRNRPPVAVSLQAFFRPARNRNFMGFSFAVGLATFSIFVLAPFIAPFVTDPDGVAAPVTWLGIMYVISQLVWVLIAQPWGVMMDRFGRKPVVILGTLYPLSWLGYLFMTSNNYTYLLPLISLLGGLLAPAFWEGVNQMMLTLTPRRHRISYVAWYMTVVGVVSSGGPILGGVMRDLLDPVRIQVFPGLVFGSFQIVLLMSLFCLVASVLVMLRVKEGKEKPVGFVVSRITSPSIFRTFVNMDVIGKTPDHLRVARALRSIEGAKSDLALTEVIDRLDDPHPEVREEAARALGRIRSSEAVDSLIVRLQDEHSPIRTHSARALGRIGDRRAIPYLIQGIAAPSEDLQEACIEALGEIGGDESARRLFELFRETRSERVLASGAEAISRLGILEAAWEILPRMHQTINPVLQAQLAISVGNLLGPSGRFYRYITGNEEHRSLRVQRLFEEASHTAGRLDRRTNVRTERKPLSRAVRHIGELLEQCRNREALDQLSVLGPRIVAAVRGTGVEDPGSALEDTLLHFPRLGLWWWFLGEARKLSDGHGNDQAVVLDVLLGVYFLAYYRHGEYPFPQKWYAC